jgi:3-oxoacyl-(acyl-carrier-protein) synthase
LAGQRDQMRAYSPAKHSRGLFVANEGPLLEMDLAICNGFGFGGVNASALFRRWTDELPGTTSGGDS